ncbi:MAG: cytochrome c maturation protein CcmE [Gammaproteobacteria bacterium]|nr:cytochrome c maturation protein CcmE [Gammaproteobacteria bacterium]MDH3768305.1 cytochrome c maturation protein CcmE [Gammaproteobacteria bacterium]
MTPRHKRMWGVGLVLIGAGVATVLGLQAFRENLLYFYTPSQISSGEAPTARVFRIGGLVLPNSVSREPGSLEVSFVLSDNLDTVTVAYSKILPDLFREGQGIIARGKLNDNGVFVAEEVLAKHDENYMPPELAEALEGTGHPGQAKPE